MIFNRATNTIFIFILLLIPKSLSLNAVDVSKRTSHLNSVLIEFDAFVEETMETWGIPGAAIAIVQSGNTVFMKGYGVRELGQSDAIDNQTVFRIASVSKPFTSTLTGLLVQEGILDWDDRIIDYLPDFTLQDTSNTHRLTIRHLLSHTSGLVPHAFDDLLESNVPYPKIVEELKNAPIVNKVGIQYGYQNMLFGLIGDLIETATGRSYENLVKDRLFMPLGMKDASMGWDAYMAAPNRAHPHVRRNYLWKVARDKQAYYSVLPSAGINASISDMAQWLRAQMGGMPEIIPLEVLQETWTPIIRTPGERRKYYWNGRVRDTYYGMGWRIFDYAGYTMITHSGGIQGYLSQIAFIPDQNIGIVVLMNSQRINFLLPTFFDMFLKLNEL